MTVIINEGDVWLKPCHLSEPGLYAKVTGLEDDLFICEGKVPSKPFFSDEQLSTDYIQWLSKIPVRS